MLHKITLPLLTALTLIGCNPGISDTPDEKAPSERAANQLRRFSDCGELREQMADTWLDTIVQYRYSNSYYYGAEDDLASDSDSSAESGGDGGGSGSAEPTDYSETNTQEEGVDEPDIVKTDGNFVYVTHAGELSIIKSWPADETSIVSRLDLGSATPQQMFLNGDRVVVFAYDYSDYSYDESVYDNGYYSRAFVIDVADRSNPEILREISFDGYQTSARMIGSDVYMVTSASGSMPSALWNLVWDGALGLPETDYDSTDEEREAAAASAKEILAPIVSAIVDAISTEDLIPSYSDVVYGEEISPEPLVECSDVYHPADNSWPSFLTVSHLNLDEGDSGSEVSSTSLMADGWTTYASEDNLFIAQTSWYWWDGWSDDFEVSTRIHRFSLDGADSIYEATGEVSGWLLNQFSMGEYEDHLRVATTDWGWWGASDDTEQANNVFVLDSASSDTMEVTGEVRGMAPGEQVYSARFMGDRGFVVTFRQTDPLFTLDLSDHENPTVAGELHVTGYSSYLHPVGDDHLLSVGMEGTEDGAITGLAVSLFDVSDFANPTLADRWLLESDDWSWSQALWDHHAFTYYRDTLIIPAYTYDWDYDSDEYDMFSGLVAIDVDLEEGLSEIGRVEHNDLIEGSKCRNDWMYGSEEEPKEDEVEISDSDGDLPEDATDSSEGDGSTDEGSEDSVPVEDTDTSEDDDSYYEEDCRTYYWYAQMQRSVVIEDYLYSFSDYGVKVSSLDDPSEDHASVMYWPLDTEEASK